MTVENLEANTAYTIYVVAYAGDLTSEVASVGNTTAAEVIDQNDYYKSGVEIDGVRYDQIPKVRSYYEVAADAAAVLICRSAKAVFISLMIRVMLMWPELPIHKACPKIW